MPVFEDTRIDLGAEETTITWRFGELLRERITEGVVGGYVFVDEFLRAVDDAGLLDPDTFSLLETLLVSEADMDAVPAGATGAGCVDDDDCGTGQTCDAGDCVEPADSCDALSVAVTFTGVPAEIVGIR